MPDTLEIFPIRIEAASPSGGCNQTNDEVLASQLLDDGYSNFFESRISAQTFNYAGSGSYQVTGVILNIARETLNTTKDCYVALCETSAGTPNQAAEIAGANITVPYSSISTSQGDYGFYWSGGAVTLQKGTTYAIIAKNSTAGGSYGYFWYLYQASVYANGTAWLYISSWTEYSTQDFHFQLMGCP